MQDETQKRSGFSLVGLFRGQQEPPSLFTFFFGIAFVGLMVAGVRLEYLRRRAEQQAIYEMELASHHHRHHRRHRRRSHRPRSTVVYVQTPTSMHQTPSEPRRHRRRRSSSHGESRSASRRRHRSHDSTHPVTIEGRLAS